MKKFSILLLFSLIPWTLYSQEIISRDLLTKESGELDTLKIVNIIFNEHSQLLKNDVYLKAKIKSLEKLNQLYIKSDSLNREELNLYVEKSKSDALKIKKLKTSRNLTYVGGIVLFIIGLFL